MDEQGAVEFTLLNFVGLPSLGLGDRRKEERFKFFSSIRDALAVNAVHIGAQTEFKALDDATSLTVAPAIFDDGICRHTHLVDTAQGQAAATAEHALFVATRLIEITALNDLLAASIVALQISGAVAAVLTAAATILTLAAALSATGFCVSLASTADAQPFAAASV